MHASIWPHFLSPDECDAVIAAAGRLHESRALTDNGYSEHRGGTVCWLRRRASNDWLFRRIERLGRQYARSVRIDVTRIESSLQVSVYRRGDKFDWHIDSGAPSTRFRKVTVSIQLMRASAYAGGDLEIVGAEPVLVARTRGCATAFASVLGHRVTKITRGSRIALVAWMTGPPYR